MTKKPLLFLLCIPLLFSCQKGEDDPVISLRTRKARLSGEWKVVSYQAELDGLEISYEGGEINYRRGDTFDLSIPFTWTAVFDKEGTYHFIQTSDYPADTANEAPVAYTLTGEEKGIWEFTGGNNAPSKSQLLLMATEIRSTRSDQGSNIEVVTIDQPHQGDVYDIRELSNKDLVLTYEETVAFAFGKAVNKAEIKLKKQH